MTVHIHMNRTQTVYSVVGCQRDRKHHERRKRDSSSQNIFIKTLSADIFISLFHQSVISVDNIGWLHQPADLLNSTLLQWSIKRLSAHYVLHFVQKEKWLAGFIFLGVSSSWSKTTSASPVLQSGPQSSLPPFLENRLHLWLAELNLPLEYTNPLTA